VSGWALVLVVIVAWYLVVVQAASRVAVEEMTNPLPNQQKRGTSIFPTLPVMPVVFVGAALAVDAAFETDWGSLLVAGAHAFLAALCGFSAAMNWRQLRGGFRAE